MNIIVALAAYVLAIAMLLFFWKKIRDWSDKDENNYFQSQKRNNQP